MNAGGVPKICKSSGKAPAVFSNVIPESRLEEGSLRDVLEYTSGGRVSNA